MNGNAYLTTYVHCGEEEDGTKRRRLVTQEEDREGMVGGADVVGGEGWRGGRWKGGPVVRRRRLLRRRLHRRRSSPSYSQKQKTRDKNEGVEIENLKEFGKWAVATASAH